MRKLKIGDWVRYNNKNNFIIESIRDCGYIERGCPSHYDKTDVCPGLVNDCCYGIDRGYRLKILGVSNPNNNIIIKEL